MADLSRPFGVGRGVGHHHLEAGNLRIPSGVILAVLSADARRRAIGPAEHDGAAHLAAGHVKRLGGRIDDVVDGLHGEVEGHEFNDRLETGKGRADARCR